MIIKNHFIYKVCLQAENIFHQSFGKFVRIALSRDTNIWTTLIVIFKMFA